MFILFELWLKIHIYSQLGLNPDFAVGCKICTDAAVGIKNPQGQALWPDSDRKRHEPTKALLGALSGLTLTKMRSILRQPKANFAIAKFGIKQNFNHLNKSGKVCKAFGGS
jgi:hypothetical protein